MRAELRLNNLLKYVRVEIRPHSLLSFRVRTECKEYGRSVYPQYPARRQDEEGLFTFK